MTNSNLIALSMADRWSGFWQGNIGAWILERGVAICLLLIGGLLAARFINWSARRVVRRIDAEYRETDQLVRTESAKHRQAVASVISWVSVALLFVLVAVQITDILAIPVGSLVAPAAVLGAALGFGAQRIVQDLLSGFFIITEKQYGFGDLVALTVAGINAPAEGTVEDVTLRVTKLRSTEGEMFTIPNGQIVKTLNLSKDWARSVIDIPVPTSADLNRVNDVLHEVSEKAMQDPGPERAPTGRAATDGCGEHRTRHRQSANGGAHAARQAVRGGQTDPCPRGPRPAPGGHRGAHRWLDPDGGGDRAPGDRRRRRGRDPGAGGAEDMTNWLKAKFGRMRVSTIVLIVAFVALFWVHEASQPEPPAPEAPAPAVVPPGFVPDPNYTWVPRTNVRRPKEPTTTTTTTSPTDTNKPNVTDGNHPDDDRGGSRRFRAAAADDADDCHADSGDHHADAARPDTDDHDSGQLGLRCPPATLATRVDVLPQLEPGDSNPTHYLCGRRAAVEVHGSQTG